MRKINFEFVEIQVVLNFAINSAKFNGKELIMLAVEFRKIILKITVL